MGDAPAPDGVAASHGAREAMDERHLRLARLAQAKAVEALRTMAPRTAVEAARVLDLGVRLERLILERPDGDAAHGRAEEDLVRRANEGWRDPGTP